MANPWFRSLVMVWVAGSISGCVAGAKKIESSGSGVKASGVAVAAVTPAEAVPPPTLVSPRAIKWVPFPLAGRGVTAAVLSGDVDKSGPFVLRIKSPAGTKVPPHWHPGDQHLTVISGTFAIGMGDVFNARALKGMPAGSYALVPRAMRHFAFSKTETVVQVHGLGPFQINFVNPANDPRTKSVGR